MESMPIKEMRLDKVQIAMVEEFSPQLYDNLKVAIDEDFWTKHMLVRLSGSFYGALHNEKVRCTVDVPDGAWEMFKDRHTPQWFKKRWPVKCETHILYVKRYRAVCPHIAKVQGDGDSAHIKWLELQDTQKDNPLSEAIESDSRRNY